MNHEPPVVTRRNIWLLLFLPFITVVGKRNKSSQWFFRLQDWGLLSLLRLQGLTNKPIDDQSSKKEVFNNKQQHLPMAMSKHQQQCLLDLRFTGRALFHLCQRTLIFNKSVFCYCRWWLLQYCFFSLSLLSPSLLSWLWLLLLALLLLLLLLVVVVIVAATVELSYDAR